MTFGCAVRRGPSEGLRWASWSVFPITPFEGANRVDAMQWVFGLMAAALFGGLLWRGLGRRDWWASAEALRNGASDSLVTEPTPELQLQEWELELHDGSQGVEARIESRLQILDCLVVEADREDERLQTLLKPNCDGAELTAAEVQRARHLHQAGLTIREISRRLGCSPEAVMESLSEGFGPQNRAA